MKNIIFIGGPMGVGKTSTAKQTAKKLSSSVFLDGDWCWDMYPFVVNEENKQMVITNICFLLNSFIANSTIENIVFCWVMDKQDILDGIKKKLQLDDCNFFSFSLICSEEELTRRISRDIEQELRSKTVLPNAIQRLPLFNKLTTTLIDTTQKNIDDTASVIIEKISSHTSSP